MIDVFLRFCLSLIIIPLACIYFYLLIHSSKYYIFINLLHRETGVINYSFAFIMM
jgi:hypothetical protein